MIILWVNIRVQPLPSWNSIFGTTWLRFSSRSRFRTRARNLVGPRPGTSWASTNPSGRALALTLACYASCDRAPPEMHPLKMFEILGHPHFKQLHGHKIPMNATNSPDRLNLYIFILNLSYHSFVSVHDIQQKQLLNKISVYAFTSLLIPADITVLPMRRFPSRARVMVVPPFDHPWRHQRSRDHHYDAQFIYRIEKSLLSGTMHFS